MADAEPKRLFAFAEMLSIVEKISRNAPEAVLIGGQAVGFWSEQYSGRLATVAGAPRIASKDLDFLGTASDANLCATRLGTTATLPKATDRMTPLSGVVFLESGDGGRFRIDFLRNPYGVSADAIRQTAVSIRVGAEDGYSFLVMHPIICMESRVFNVAGLPKQYATPLGLQQLRASVACGREYLRDLLDGKFPEPSPARAVMDLNERIARFCVRNQVARTVLLEHGIDPAGAMVLDDRLPEAFRTKRWPQLQRQLDARLGKDRGRADPEPMP